jgi:hypothetical protein
LGFFGQEEERRLKNTLMGIGSQGEKWRQFADLKMIEIVPNPKPRKFLKLLHE